MNSSIIILCVAILVVFWIAIKSQHDQNKLEQWAIGGRSFGVILVFVLMGGELYTTFTFLGGSGLAYNKGGACYYILCYPTIGYIIGYWILPKIWEYAKQHNLVSQSDYYIKKYNSRTLGLIVSLIGVLSLIPYLVLQIKGLGVIVNQTTYGMVPVTYAIFICSFIMVAYVVIGGMRGSVRVAIIKDIMILCLVFFLGIYLPFHYYGGIEEVINLVELKQENFTAISQKDFNHIWFFSTVLISAIGLYMWPHSFASIFTSQNSKVLKKNAIIMPLYQFLLMFVFIIGFVAVLQIPGLSKPDSELALLKLVIKSFDPWFVGIVGVAGVLTALVPGSIILLTIATVLVKNIFGNFISIDAPKELTIIKSSVPCVMIIALIANNYAGETIVSLLIIGYGLVSQLFPALIFSLFDKNPISKTGAILGMMTGIGMMFISIFGKVNIGNILPTSLTGLNFGVIALVMNLLVMLIVSLITKCNKKLLNFQ